MLLRLLAAARGDGAKIYGRLDADRRPGAARRDGYVFFEGRDDDVISSAGYRIGPAEIEDGLLRHPAVANAAAVGKPDPLRGEIVKAFIVLKPGFSPSPELAKEIQAHAGRGCRRTNIRARSNSRPNCR